MPINPVGPKPRGGYFFGMTPIEATISFIVAILGGFVLENLFPTRSWWALTGIIFSFFVLGHMYFTSTRFIVLPEFITLIACVNWVVAPWLAYFYPPGFTEFRMVIPMSEYLSFTVPCVMALWLGLHLPLRYRGIIGSRMVIPVVSRRAYFLIDLVILFSLILSASSHHLPRILSFLYYVVANLRFVCVFILMFLSARGWPLRAAVVYISLFSESASGGVFYESIMWLGYMMICVAYTHKWRLRLIAALIIAFWAVTTLNVVKMGYREIIGEKKYTQIQKLSLLGQMMVGQVTNDRHWKTEVVFGDKLVRWNQGWIIARVMATVPTVEPYAQGETIYTAIGASILPRIFSPNKVTAASKEVFEKYTDIRLSEGTSMALGTAGEFYANFGKMGGIIAVGIYGWVIGFAFSQFARFSRSNALWWAWVPFVMFSALVCEWNLADILNHIIKSLVVMVLAVKMLPVFQKYLFPKVPRVS